jgi:hypothetical protein
MVSSSAMMFRALLVSLLLVGCGKANDLGRLQDEVIQIAQSYRPTIEELKESAMDLEKHAKVVGPASARLNEAKIECNRMLNEIDNTKRTQVSNSSATDDDAVKLADNLEDDLRLGIARVTIDLDAVETWVAVGERMPSNGM